MIAALSYRGYLDTQAVNYPYQGPKVCYSNNFKLKFLIIMIYKNYFIFILQFVIHIVFI